MKDLLLLLENDYKVLGKLVTLTNCFENPEEASEGLLLPCLYLLYLRLEVTGGIMFRVGNSYIF